MSIPGKVNDDRENSEITSLKNLLQCSKRTEKREREISTKNWDALSNWTQTTPICCYTNKTQGKNKHKKGSSKNNNTTTSRNPFSPSDFKRQEQQNVKHQNKDKPNNIESNTGPTNPSKNNRCSQYEIPLLKETSSDECCKTDNSVMHKQNKYSRSTNVLSYEKPSWRFLIDINDFEYIERTAPKDKVYHFLKRTKSSYSKHSSLSTKHQIIDPAGFIDEQIIVAYKNSRNFVPDQELRSLMARIGNLHTHDFEPKDLQKRLYVTSCIKKIPVTFGECEVVKKQESSTTQHPENGNKSPKKNKIAKHKIKKGSGKKTSHKSSKYQQQHQNSTLINKKCILPKITSKQQKHNITLPTTGTLVKTSPSIHNVFTNPIQTPSSQIHFQTEELYLPLLHHSNYPQINYTSKLQYLKRPEVKLPVVAGIKISLSSTSNSGLVL